MGNEGGEEGPVGAMPDAKGKGKKEVASMKALGQLQAVRSSYQGVCKVFQVEPEKDVLGWLKGEIDKPKTLKRKNMQKVFVSDEHAQPGNVATLMDLCAGYPFVKNIHFYRCRIGDEGLKWVAALLRASCDPWAKMTSQIKRIDICDDRAGQPWPSLEEPPNPFPPKVFATLKKKKKKGKKGKDDAKSSRSRSPSPPRAGSGGRGKAPPRPRTPPPIPFPDTDGSEDAPIGLEGITTFATALPLPGLSLRVLVLDRNPMSDAAVRRLAMGIRKCKTLINVSLVGCNITAKSCFALGTIIAAPEDGMHVGAKAFELAKLQPSLTNLNLSENPLGVEGSIILADAIGQNKSLITVGFSDIGLPLEPESNSAYDAFGHMMLQNDTLKIVDLGRNPITSQQFAQYLLPAITVKLNVAYVKVMHTLDRTLVKQYLSIVKGRGRKKRKGKGKKK